jgi:hypothetical protein
MADEIIVQCEICFSNIGRIKESEAKPPFHGSQFTTLFPGRGVPDPFLWDAPWEDLRCPVCNFRPFINRNRIMDENRKYYGYSHECPTCHEFFKSPQALAGHKNKHRSD